MMRFMTQKAWRLLRGMEITNKPWGLVIVTENRKLMRRGMCEMLKKSGYQLLGLNDKQQHVWLKPF